VSRFAPLRGRLTQWAVMPATRTRTRTRRPPRVAGLVAGVACVAVLAGCAETGREGGGESRRTPGGSPPAAAPTATPTTDPTVEPDTPTGWGPTEGELAEAAELVAGMDLGEQAATVLMPGFWGYSAETPAPVEAEQNRAMHGVDSAVQARRVHGYDSFFLRPEVISDALQVATLVLGLRDGEGADPLPLLLSIDQEGGPVQRLRTGVETVPSASWVGSTGDEEYAREVARANGRALRELGVTMVLAPVADVDPDGTSALGRRVYSSDPRLAARMVVATVEAYLEVGVLPVVKHFPGLGTVEGDSHFSLPVQELSVEDMRAGELGVFETAVRAGAPLVMTGHVSVEELDPGVPASLSPAVVQGLLRDDLGFEGVAVTDSQGMGPIHARYGAREGAVLSLLAGNDLVLNSPYPQRALTAVQEAVAQGRLPAERLAEAATRVTALRLYLARLLQETAPAE
jgi:beta-N-acetylhexosaminidase